MLLRRKNPLIQRQKKRRSRLKNSRATSQAAISRSRKAKAHHHHLRNLMLLRRKNPLILLDSQIPSHRTRVPHSSTPAVAASDVFHLPLPIRHFVSRFGENCLDRRVGI